MPATLAVNLNRLRDLSGARSVRLAREDELSGLYPECETGAMPPLGPLYRDTPKHAITRCVALPIVHVFETVSVNEQQ